MKKTILALMGSCLLLAACGSAPDEAAGNPQGNVSEQVSDTPTSGN
jgi:starvation-inducible outer membrane lipoprotein